MEAIRYLESINFWKYIIIALTSNSVNPSEVFVDTSIMWGGSKASSITWLRVKVNVLVDLLLPKIV